MILAGLRKRPARLSDGPVKIPAGDPDFNDRPS